MEKDGRGSSSGGFSWGTFSRSSNCPFLPSSSSSSRAEAGASFDFVRQPDWFGSLESVRERRKTGKPIYDPLSPSLVC